MHEFDQNILYVCMEISQWLHSHLVHLLCAIKRETK
jgi:hypothetical protein